MRARDAEVGQEPVGRPPGEYFQEPREVGVVKLKRPAGLLEPRPGDFEIPRIEVESDKRSAWGDAFQEFDRMPAKPDRAIDDELPGPRIQELENFREENRDVG